MTPSETHLGGETNCHISFWNQVSRISHQSLFTPCSTTDITTHIKLYQTILDNRSFACLGSARQREPSYWFQREASLKISPGWRLHRWVHMKVMMHDMYQPITARNPSMATTTPLPVPGGWLISSEPAANTQTSQGMRSCIFTCIVANCTTGSKTCMTISK